MEIETVFKGVLPFMGGFVVGLFAIRAGKVAAFTLIVVLATLMLTGTMIPVKETIIEHSRPAVSALKQLLISVPAGTIVGLLLGIAVAHLKRSKSV